MKHFLCKYIPPRADFLTTLTDEEKGWIGRHSEFLDDLLNEGTIVAHGPVIGPNGTYGVSLFSIGDDQDITETTARDPIVAQGIGHYEHYPMLHIKSRK
ncbi:hypothetical protein GCM10011491_44140 [Brucella endophytica]|uniref:YCII-related domain-containing protein n=1 Tax=Brucella endophytica TaxID=1963359 RepID=A0A916SPQ4_9HYPH|nr:YciI family protein [Brucella endophytica]GGB11396.1 hypothetical protein GCM10011491_44140 [Brucella endophytica]